MVRHAPHGVSAAGESGRLTEFAAESVRNTSARCWPNTLPRCRHGRRPPCGAAWFTTLSTSDCISPSSTARTSGTHTTAAAVTTRARTRIRLGHPHRTPAGGAVERSGTEKHRLEEEAAQVEAAPRACSGDSTRGERHGGARAWGREDRDAQLAAAKAQVFARKSKSVPRRWQRARKSCCSRCRIWGSLGVRLGWMMTRQSGSPGHPQVTSAGFTRGMSQGAFRGWAREIGQGSHGQMRAHARSRQVGGGYIVVGASSWLHEERALSVLIALMVSTRQFLLVRTSKLHGIRRTQRDCLPATQRMATVGRVWPCRGSSSQPPCPGECSM